MHILLYFTPMCDEIKLEMFLARIRSKAKASPERASETDRRVHRTLPVPVSEPVLMLTTSAFHALHIFVTGTVRFHSNRSVF